MNAALTLLKCAISRIKQPDKPPPYTSADAVQQSGKKLAYVLRARAALNVGIKIRLGNHFEYRYTPKELAALLVWLKNYSPKVGKPIGKKVTLPKWTQLRRKKFMATIRKNKEQGNDRTSKGP